MNSPIGHIPLLLKNIIDGDELAYAELYHIYFGKVFAYAHKLTKCKEIANDVAQDIFVKLWENRANINLALNFEAFLCTVTRNHIINLLKRASKEKIIQQKIFNGMQQLFINPEEAVSLKNLEQLYQEAIGKLPEQRQRVYRLRKIEDLSFQEIAEALKISTNTVKNHMVESLKFIRNYISKKEKVMLLTPWLLYIFKTLLIAILLPHLF